MKPPVTIFLLAANIWPHLAHVDVLGYSLWDVQQNCLHPEKIWTAFWKGDGILLNRLILPGFMHIDDHHLYYNMLSLCWKGVNLEKKMGSAAFLQLVVFSLVVSHMLMVLLAYLLYANSEFGSSYHTCAVGFSAVLFSLKYVWNQESGGSTNIMGLAIPTRHAAWFELFLVSIVTPNASFVGHLAGILAGILYLHMVPILNAILPFDIPGERHRYTYASGYASGSLDGEHGSERVSPDASFNNSHDSSWLFGGTRTRRNTMFVSRNTYRPSTDSVGGDVGLDLDLDPIPDRDHTHKYTRPSQSAFIATTGTATRSEPHPEPSAPLAPSGLSSFYQQPLSPEPSPVDADELRRRRLERLEGKKKSTFI